MNISKLRSLAAPPRIGKLAEEIRKMESSGFSVIFPIFGGSGQGGDFRNLRQCFGIFNGIPMPDSKGDRGGQVIACAGNTANCATKLTFGSRLPVPLVWPFNCTLCPHVSWGSPGAAGRQKPNPQRMGKISTGTAGVKSACHRCRKGKRCAIWGVVCSWDQSDAEENPLLLLKSHAGAAA